MKFYLTNQETAEEVVVLGEHKGHYGFRQTLLLGFMGGVYIALAALGNLIACHYIGGGVGRFVGAMVFPTGLMLVVLVGGSLFTGDCLAFLALTKDKIRRTIYFRNLCGVWLGNLLGSILIAGACVMAGNFNDEAFSSYIIHFAEHKVHLTMWQAVASGFLCNILVAIGVWFALASKELAGKILAIWFPIMLFILCGFQHVVANMFYVSAAGMLDPSIYTFGEVALHLLFVTIGNFLSGAIFLPCIYHFLYTRAN